MMEIGEDFSINKMSPSSYYTISKRELNPELSGVSNLVLDMIDFRDRIRPLAKDIALQEYSNKHQRFSYEEHKAARADLYKEIGDEDRDPSFLDAAEATV